MDHQRRPAGGVEHPVARAFQLPQHLDQRNAIQSGRKTIEQLGGLGVAERGQLLDLAQPDGEHVVEHRLVHIRQQYFDEMLALPGAVRRGQGDLFAKYAVARRVSVAADLKTPIRTGHLQQPARPAAVDRRQILPPHGREAVEHRTNELQQGRLAGLVRTVEDVQRIGEFFDPQTAPNTETFDFQVGDSHT